jgi:hypothetical protein
MALTDIVTYAGATMSYEMSRGNTGTPTDIQSGQRNSVEIPSAAGNIFIMSV